MIAYELTFEFTVRDGWPPSATLIAFRETADDVIRILDYLGRQFLTNIQLVTIEEI